MSRIKQTISFFSKCHVNVFSVKKKGIPGGKKRPAEPPQGSFQAHSLCFFVWDRAVHEQLCDFHGGFFFERGESLKWKSKGMFCANVT